MEINKKKIVVISPVRNEAEYIENTVKSMLEQTLKPIEWIIVDDGSTDDTQKIVNRLIEASDWIRVVSKPDRGKRAVGPGVVETFYFGYEQIQHENYDFICKMDGDIKFGPNYFETLVRFFEEDKYLGAASGKPFIDQNGKLVEERHNDEMVAGMINFYSRECFESIGGFVRQVHWDGITFHRARMKGWRTRSINHEDLNFIHLRQMGSSYKSIAEGRMRWGRGQYFMGTPLLYIIAISVYRSFEKPYIVGGALIFIGYLKAFFGRMKRYDDSNFRKSLRAWQWERLGIGRRLENIPE